MTDKLEIVIIELPKAKRIYKKDAKNEISHWMMFLDEPNQEEVEKIMSGNEELKKAWDELQRVSGDETLERIAELRIKGIMDEMAAREYAENERKKNRNGKAEWKKEEKNGSKNKAIEIAKNMLEEKIPMETIIRLTGLKKEEIEKL